MKKSLKKRGQKILKKFSKASVQVGAESKEHIRENIIGRFSHIASIRLLILEWGLLVVALIMLAIAQAFWFGDSYAGNSWSTGGTYIEATIGEVNSMNPLFANTNSERVLSRLMFSTIAAIDRSGHPAPQLAEYIRPSENGRIWTVKIRDDLKWSDGEPLTTDDVMFTLNLIKNPAVNTIYDANLANVKVETNENNEIVFTLATPYADFMTALVIPVVPEHLLSDSDPKTLIEDSFSNAPTGSGPFFFNAAQSSSTSNEKVIYLSSNPYYYRKQTMLSSFAIHIFTDQESIISAINAGTVTATAELTEAVDDKITSAQFHHKNSSLNSGAFIFFNTTSQNVKDIAVREAIRQGINMAEIRNEAPNTIALNYPLLESQLKLENYPALPEYNLEAAKSKLAELNGGERKFLEIATVNSGFLPKVSELVGNALTELGYDVHISTYEENQEFVSNVLSKRSYDLLIYEIELGADPDPLPYYHSSQVSQSGLNLSNYRNALVDDLLLGGRETLDESLRIKKYERFLEYWVSNVPAIGIYQPNLAYYYNRNVRTFSNDLKLVTALDRFNDVNTWAVNTATKNKTP